MSDEDVERFTTDLLLAAIDTTSVTGLWLLYVLATHKELQVPIEASSVACLWWHYGLSKHKEIYNPSHGHVLRISKWQGCLSCVIFVELDTKIRYFGG